MKTNRKWGEDGILSRATWEDQRKKHKSRRDSQKDQCRGKSNQEGVTHYSSENLLVFLQGLNDKHP